MAKRDVMIGVRMPSALRDELKRLADSDRRTVATYVLHVLEAHVAWAREVEAAQQDQPEKPRRRVAS